MPFAASAAVIAGAAAVGGAYMSSEAAKDASKKQSESTDKAIVATNAQNSQSRQDLAPYRDAGVAALTRLQHLAGLGDPNAQARDQAASAAGIRKPTMADAAAETLQHHMQVFGTGYTSGSNMAAKEQEEKAVYDRMLNEYGNKVAQIAPNTASGAQGGEGDYGDLTRQFASSDLAKDPVYNSGLQFGLDEGTKAIERRSAAAGGYDSGAALKALTRFGNDYGSTKAADSYGRFRDYQDSTYGKLSGIAGMGSGATSVGIGAGANATSNVAGLMSGQGNASAAASLAGGNALSGGVTNAANYYNQNQLLSQLQGGGARAQSGRTSVVDDGSQYAG